MTAVPTGLDATLSARARPTSSHRDQLLPLLPALRTVVPGAGLPRGAVVAVAPDPLREGPGGATSLAFALLAAATTAGVWWAAVGVADAGILALAEMGVDLDHLVLIPRPGGRWAEVAALLIDGMDGVLLCPPGPVRPAVARRLTARVRSRRVALVVLCRHAPWPEGADLHLGVGTGHWLGAEKGHGHLRGRRVEITTTGRRGAARPVRTELWLPSSSGAPTPVEGHDRHDRTVVEGHDRHARTVVEGHDRRIGKRRGCGSP